jgi:hypothetical protein
MPTFRKRTRSTIYLRLWAAFREEQDQQYTRGSGQHSEKNKINNILEALGSIQRRTRRTCIINLEFLLFIALLRVN